MPKPPTPMDTTEIAARPENDRRQRRRFSRDEKLRILAEADRCTARGAIAALLRREGIYSSQLTAWRQQLRVHGEAGLEAKSPGPKAKHDDRGRKMERLERKNRQLEHELMVARKLLELAGKAHEILGVALPSLDDDETR